VAPLDDATLAALDQWMGERGSQRALPHPRTGRPADFRSPCAAPESEQPGSAAALTTRCGLPDSSAPTEQPSTSPRNTYATELVNAGMTLQALMALLGHVTPKMTTRYADLAVTTVRASYDSAMARIRETRQLPLVVSPGRCSTHAETDDGGEVPMSFAVPGAGLRQRCRPRH